MTRTSAFPQYGHRDGGLSASVYRKEENGFCRVRQLLHILKRLRLHYKLLPLQSDYSNQGSCGHGQGKSASLWLWPSSRHVKYGDQENILHLRAGQKDEKDKGVVGGRPTGDMYPTGWHCFHWCDSCDPFSRRSHLESIISVTSA